MKKLILALLFGLLAVPALQAAQASQEETKVSAVELVNSNEKEICAICLDQLKNPIQLLCPHNNKFDTQCFLEYVVSQARQGFRIECPLCKNNVLAGRIRQAEVLLPIDQDNEPARLDAERREKFQASVIVVCDIGFYGILCLIAALKTSDEKRDARETFTLVAFLASAVTGFCSHRAYQNCPPEISVKLQRTKEFIKRHKKEIGTLAALAFLGLLGKKVLSARK